MRLNKTNTNDFFRHTIPILIPTDEGMLELLIAFVVTDTLEVVPDYAIDSAVKLEPDDELTLANSPDFDGSDELWILPAVVRARKIIGPLADNIPGGEGGELVSPSELFRIIGGVDSTDLIQMLARFRENLSIDDGIGRIIDRIVKKQRGY